MCGATDPQRCWEIVLYAAPALIEEFPNDLFFDDDLVWHQQHFGRAGQIATANLWVDGGKLYSMVHISDLVQRIGRRREHKTRIENRFKGWHLMVLNAIGNFALEHGLARIYSPTAEFARRHTDRRRNVRPEMFERIYDRAVHTRFVAQREGDWWRIDVKDNAQRLVVATRHADACAAENTVCIVHDVERGLGHEDVDPDFARHAARTAAASLETMLRIELAAGLRTTYNVVGVLFDELRAAIEPGGHALAFHSYDHRVAAPDAGPDDPAFRQLHKCRTVDYRIKGYRPARSIITPELTDANLCAFNFEWLANSLPLPRPTMHNRIVKIPIRFDDFALYKAQLPYDEWERAALRIIAESDFVAFGLHDCYAPFWLPHYERFIDTLRAMGALRTLDAVAFDVILRMAG